MKHFRAPVPTPLAPPPPGLKSRSAAGNRNRAKVKRAKLAKQGGRCLYCRCALSVRRATIEHRTPLARGGADAASNADVACYPCNSAKGTLTKREFERAIFNPSLKRDPWPLYLACVEIRLKRRTEQACKRLRSIVDAA